MELKSDLDDIDEDISNLKKVKPSPSYDSDFWTANAGISRLYQLRVGVDSRLKFLKYKETSDENVSEDDWLADEQAQNLERQILAYRQAEEIAKKQASRLIKDSRTELSAIFFNLFYTSPQGLNIRNGGKGRRETNIQSDMRKQMKEMYCPDAPKRALWDPITANWEMAGTLHVAHLYAWRQVDSMDAIFGPGSKDEIFSPRNGLFMRKSISNALDEGRIAIVPNVDLEPKDQDFPHDDLAKQTQSLRDWEKASTKEYKVVVLERNIKHLQDNIWQDRGELKTLADLNGRPLKFLNDFRPRARYVWWTFMNAILQASWRQNFDENNVLFREVAKATRYWGSPGSYVKKNMLRGFVDELGQDIESILDISEDDTGDTSDLDQDKIIPGVITNEALFQAKEAEKKNDESGDEDEPGEDDEDDFRYED